MFCPSCGTKATEGQAFCRNCGADLRQVTDEAAQVDTPTEAHPITAPTAPVPLAPPPATAPTGPVAPTQRLDHLPPPSATAPHPAASAPPDVSGGGHPVAAYVGIGAIALLGLASALAWISTPFQSLDGFDTPLAVLWSDAAQRGVGIAVPFIVVALGVLAVAFLAPGPRPLGAAFLAAGGFAILLVAIYLARASSLTPPGSSLMDSASVAVWLVLMSSLIAVVSGVMLVMGREGNAATW